MNEFDKLEEQIADMVSECRRLQIELLALRNRFPDDARIAQQLAKMKAASVELRRIEREVQQEYYGDEDPRAFPV
jgi:hypothetical protein